MPDPSQPARASAFDRIRTLLLSANIVWTTLCLGGVLARTREVTAILTALLIVAHVCEPRRGTRAHLAGWLFLPFLAYAAMNVAWITPVRWLGWIDWVNWAQAIAVFWIVLNGIREPTCRAFLWGLLVALGVAAALLGIYQHFVRPDWIMLGRKQADQYIGRSAGPFGIPNSLGALLALIMPATGFVAFSRGRPVGIRVLCGAALAIMATGFVLAISRGAWFSLAAAFAFRPLVTPGVHLRRRIATALGAVLVALALAAVFYAVFPLMRVRAKQLITDVGEKSRPILWASAVGIFREHPALGAGGGSFDTLFEKSRPEGFRDQPFYTHCDYLNTLCDYGAVGFVLFFGVAALVACRCARAKGLAGAAFTGLLAFAFHLLIEFHLKIPALAIIVATMLALVTREVWPASETSAQGEGSRFPSALGLLTACAAIALTAFWILPMDRAEEYRRSARDKIDKMAKHEIDAATQGDALTSERADFMKAVEIDPGNGQAWSDLAYVDSLLALAEPKRTIDLGAEAARDGGRALEICPIMAEFWIRRGMGLDMQYKWDEGGACFAKAVALAPNRADVWYYQAYHLSLTYREVEPAIAAADVSLRLDPDFLLAQSLRQRLEIRLQKRS